jgi:hypothetical protein
MSHVSKKDREAARMLLAFNMPSGQEVGCDVWQPWGVEQGLHLNQVTNDLLSCLKQSWFGFCQLVAQLLRMFLGIQLSALAVDKTQAKIWPHFTLLRYTSCCVLACAGARQQSPLQ